MAKQLIILVHGMGSHPKGQIKKDFIAALGDRIGAFGLNANDITSTVDYAEFNYNDFLDTIRKQFAENAQARKKGFTYLTGKGFAEQLLTQLTNFESKFGKDEFFYTHWLDVILYATMYFGEVIRRDFIDFFEKQRKKYGHANIHIVCHSLGTALVHDALAKYYRTNASAYDDIADLKTGEFNIASLWTFANVSRMVNILNDLSDPNHSTVTTGAGGCTRRIINIRNKYDPFTWFKTYDRNNNPKESLEISAIRNVNTHDFYEYITEPRVAREILNTIYGQSISDDQFKAGEGEYKKLILNAQVKELKGLIESARDQSKESIKDAINSFKEIIAKIKELQVNISSQQE